jgi:hypothetical protein
VLVGWRSQFEIHVTMHPTIVDPFARITSSPRTGLMAGDHLDDRTVDGIAPSGLTKEQKGGP